MLKAALEQLVSPDVAAQWLRHLLTWVQQPSQTVLELQLAPSGTIRLQSGGGGGGDGGGGGGGGGRRQCDGMAPYRLRSAEPAQRSPIQWHRG